jgi:hypothetical protein
MAQSSQSVEPPQKPGRFWLTMACGVRVNALYYQKKVLGREDWRV